MWEGTDCLNAALSSVMTSLQVMVASARSVGWGRNEKLKFLYLIPYPSALMCSMQTQVSDTDWFTPLTRLSIHTADNFLLTLLFLMSVSILSGCPIINICSCLQDMKLSWIGLMAFRPYTGFHYSKLPNYLSYDCGNFSNISGMGWAGSLTWTIWYR